CARSNWDNWYFDVW
nr:immunoglobulin heavy chain junction region [Mus musculus]MBK4185999.1 immunoglobulin heavy chain junction region [Mus musculus]MBK4186000.1 immunoglobulin heavy chain junction region [Mus musculus]MBK4186001.1 immunoglobulin heavy chain junction region [Mus musculus]MBK4186002.1 immunoglobulin heavy chain junction region [Mus musculus]